MEVARLCDRVGTVRAGGLEAPNSDLTVCLPEQRSRFVLPAAKWRMPEWHKDEQGEVDLVHIKMPSVSLCVRVEDIFFS